MVAASVSELPTWTAEAALPGQPAAAQQAVRGDGEEERAAADDEDGGDLVTQGPVDLTLEPHLYG